VGLDRLGPLSNGREKGYAKKTKGQKGYPKRLKREREGRGESAKVGWM
jgi:hypothetical protein